MATTGDDSAVVERLSLDEIETPEREEKLHPEENEDSEEWQEFRESIGAEPDIPPICVRRDDGVELIDGDRRLRALQDNYDDGVEAAGDVRCVVYDADKNELDETEKTLKMIEANEHRKASDPYQRAWNVAQLVAPWLLPPAERKDDVERMTNSELADRRGRSSSAISQWLNPLRNKYPIRNVLGKVGNSSMGRDQMGADKIDTIDKVIQVLNHGNENSRGVLASNESAWVADQLDEMRGVGLGEIKQVAEKAADEGWNSDKFLETLRENFAEKEETPDKAAKTMDEGTLGGSDPFADTSPGQTYDDRETGDIETDEETPETDFQQEPEHPVNFDDPNLDVDWDALVDEGDLLGDESLDQLTHRKYLDTVLEDEAAIMVYVLAELSGEDTEDVIRKVVQPAIVEYGEKILETEV